MPLGIAGRQGALSGFFPVTLGYGGWSADTTLHTRRFPKEISAVGSLTLQNALGHCASRAPTGCPRLDESEASSRPLEALKRAFRRRPRFQPASGHVVQAVVHSLSLFCCALRRRARRCNLFQSGTGHRLDFPPDGGAKAVPQGYDAHPIPDESRECPEIIVSPEYMEVLRWVRAAMQAESPWP